MIKVTLTGSGVARISVGKNSVKTLLYINFKKCFKSIFKIRTKILIIFPNFSKKFQVNCEKILRKWKKIDRIFF